MATTTAAKLRHVNGVLCLDKPTGISSNTALQIVKHLFKARKAGHTGSLDPLATGMLPICFGEATKFSQFLLNADKAYQVVAKLGVRTTTSDSEGEVVSQRPVPTLTLAELEEILAPFRGEIKQIPSMYSALKYQGQPLYKLARQGIVVEREARDLTIYELRVIDFSDTELRLHVHCSKGTYVRTLIDDIGEAMGCGAHVSELFRSAVGPFDASSMISMERLKASYENERFAALDGFLLPITTMLGHYPAINVSSTLCFYLQQGQTVTLNESVAPGYVQLLTTSGEFFGVGEVLADGSLVPKRLVTLNKNK